MRTAYRIALYYANNPIEKIEIASETACFITVRYPSTIKKHAFYQRKEKKTGDVFDTFDAAKKELIARKLRAIESFETRLREARSELNDLNRLEEPQ